MVLYYGQGLRINTVDQPSIFLQSLPPVSTSSAHRPVDRSPSGTMSKTLMVFGLTVMVVCACFAGVPTVGANSPSPVIGYGAIGKGGNPGCSPKNPKACNPVPANPYHRGCEKEDHCRNGPRKLLGEGIQANAPIHFI
ncbi:hypothetical protein SADUNF_Sadunf19G0092400 [Salix dunnii]|uniref:Rapid ALkalinization Factor n=1 Tax=Salix dunnii TaxID=1413687 RepID=A0A835J218_9ROSI|nr:hypothetical protein SADUNF_Sadunf19G0092400 [Salix dunnii]